MLKREDKGQFFWIAVDTQHVPDYLSVVEKPVDLQTLQMWIASVHPSTEKFIVEVTRMFSNAKLYNDKNHPIHEEAARLQRIFYQYIDTDKIEDDVADAISAIYCITNL
jgi:hypothetical protein